MLPGSYPSMSVSLNGRVASARQIGYADPLPVTMSPQPPVVVNLPQIVVNPPSVGSTQPVVVNPPPIVVNPRVETPVVTSPVVTTVPPTGRAYLYEDPNFGGAWVAVIAAWPTISTGRISPIRRTARRPFASNRATGCSARTWRSGVTAAFLDRVSIRNSAAR